MTTIERIKNHRKSGDFRYTDLHVAEFARIPRSWDEREVHVIAGIEATRRSSSSCINPVSGGNDGTFPSSAGAGLWCEVDLGGRNRDFPMWRTTCETDFLECGGKRACECHTALAQPYFALRSALRLSLGLRRAGRASPQVFVREGVTGAGLEVAFKLDGAGLGGNGNDRDEFPWAKLGGVGGPAFVVIGEPGPEIGRPADAGCRDPKQCEESRSSMHQDELGFSRTRAGGDHVLYDTPPSRNSKSIVAESGVEVLGRWLFLRNRQISCRKSLVEVAAHASEEYAEHRSSCLRFGAGLLLLEGTVRTAGFRCLAPCGWKRFFVSVPGIHVE